MRDPARHEHDRKTRPSICVARAIIRKSFAAEHLIERWSMWSVGYNPNRNAARDTGKAGVLWSCTRIIVTNEHHMISCFLSYRPFERWTPAPGFLRFLQSRGEASGVERLSHRHSAAWEARTDGNPMK